MIVNNYYRYLDTVELTIWVGQIEICLGHSLTIRVGGGLVMDTYYTILLKINLILLKPNKVF